MKEKPTNAYDAISPGEGRGSGGEGSKSNGFEEGKGDGAGGGSWGGDGGLESQTWLMDVRWRYEETP